MAAPKAPKLTQLGGGINREETGKATSDYEEYFKDQDSTERKGNYADVVNKYYDLATSFYEYGWGESFHFAHRHKGETLKDSLLRHEHFMAMKMGINSDSKVLDVGCGIGGPLRNIAYFTGASITGLNNNGYQVQRANEITRATGRHDRCTFVKGDFMTLPAKDGTYDAVYEIEATCHAPDARGCYGEIFRVLKPGGVFASYEWCLTDAYDPNNARHRQIKQDIMIGNGLPDVRQTSEVVQAMKDVGFTVSEVSDLASNGPNGAPDVTWYKPIDPYRKLELSSLFDGTFKTTWLGRNITHYFVWFLELIGIAPKGSMRVSAFLKKGADALVDGGREGIFTAMFWTLAKKPQ